MNTPLRRSGDLTVLPAHPAFIR